VCQNEFDRDIVLQPADLVTALQFIHDDRVEICTAVQGESVLLRGGDARVELSTLASPWPNLTALTALRPVHTVSVQSAALQDALAATKAFETSEVITFSPSDDQFTVSVDGGEAGTYASAIAGTLPHELRFSSTMCARVTKMGDDLTFELCDNVASPVIIKSGVRKCWLMQRT